MAEMSAPGMIGSETGICKLSRCIRSEPYSPLKTPYRLPMNRQTS